jgi:alpha-beta hydrolase superfamily lysophospholipase
LRDEQTRGRVVYLHGIQSHGGWYEHSSRRLCQAGFDVYFLDRRGSGLNQADRGDTPTYQRLVDDVAEFLSVQAAGQPNKTLVIGISWGGKLATALAAGYPELVDRVALICPGFFPKLSGRNRRLSKFLRLAKLLAPKKQFAVPLSDPRLFTATSRWLEFLSKDPLALHKATARFLVASQDLDKALPQMVRRIEVPVLLMLAGRDRIIENKPTRTFLKQFASKDCQVIEYPEANHTLEFEPDPDQFINDLIRWLRGHE